MLLELRSRELIVSMLVFGLMLVVVFNFALSVTPQRVTTVAPGILWASFAFRRSPGHESGLRQGAGTGLDWTACCSLP